MMLLLLLEHEIDVKSTMETSHFQEFLSVASKRKIVMKTNYVLLFVVTAATIILRGR